MKKSNTYVEQKSFIAEFNDKMVDDLNILKDELFG